MSTIQTIDNELPSTARPKINANFAALNTDKSETTHTHDDRYFTEAEVTTALAAKSNTGHTHTASEAGLGNVQNYGIASQAEAEAGAVSNKYMTPQRTAQAIAALAEATISQELFIPPSLNQGGTLAFTGAINNFPIADISNTQGVFFGFKVPHDFTTLVSCVVVMYPDTTETVQADVTTSWGTVGEALNAGGATVNDLTASATINQILEFNINSGSLLTGLAANDYLGVFFDSDTSNLRIMGLKFRYS